MYNKIKHSGNRGEKLVSSYLCMLPSSSFRVYNNVMFRTKKGTTQIDHLVVSDRGIYVIETKAHKGKIYGNATSKYWTQLLYGVGGKVNKFSFYSPYYQNRGHLRNVIKTLGTQSICGIICFTSENADLSGVYCESVIPLYLLNQVMLNIYVQAPIPDYNFYDMCRKVESLNIQSAYFDRKHVNYVKSLRR